MRRILISACVLILSLTLMNCSSKSKNSSSTPEPEAAADQSGALIEDAQAGRGKKGGSAVKVSLR